MVINSFFYIENIFSEHEQLSKDNESLDSN